MLHGNEDGYEKGGHQQVHHGWPRWYQLHDKVWHVGGLTRFRGRVVKKMWREEVGGWWRWSTR